ncbi:radical SAM protein [Leptospira idonii]|uniref:radical SAM protein n=1 Tax=Leptospira idonii TaxID=1193500 RepID=UPI0014382B84|nr:radical SAM protein [Leptospira idonii]
MAESLSTLSLEVTTVCDLKCKHCFALSPPVSKARLSWESAKEIIHLGWESGFRVLHMTGGEPTLWKHLFDAVRLAQNIGYTAAYFNTHGGFLTEKFCNEWKEVSDFVFCTLSLDGKEETHDSFRGKGTWQRAVEGLKQAERAGLSVDVFFTVRKSNWEEIPEFTSWLYTHFKNIRRITLVQFHLSEDEKHSFPEELLSEEEFVSVVRMASLLCLAGYEFYFLDNPLTNVTSEKIGFILPSPSPSSRRKSHAFFFQDQTWGYAHSLREFKQKISLGEFIETKIEQPDVCISCPHEKDCETHGVLPPVEGFFGKETIPFCRRVLDYVETNV